MENGFESPKRVERDEYRSKFRFPDDKSPKKKSGRPKTKTDYLVRLILLQTALCFLTVIGVLIASKVSPAAAQRMKSDYGKIMEKDMSVSEVFEDLRDKADEVFQPIEIIEPEAKAAMAVSGTDYYNVIDDETGETVVVGEIIYDGSGGGDSASQGNSFADYRINAEAVMPVKGARLTSPFGYRTNPISGNYGFHTGIDLAAAENTPVAAAFGGTVTETGESDVWGKYVLVRHSESLETYYCHLNEIYVEEGAVIRSGETVGLLGSTGWSTGPHLHFEVRIDGVRVDPEKLLYGDED